MLVAMSNVESAPQGPDLDHIAQELTDVERALERGGFFADSSRVVLAGWAFLAPRALRAVPAAPVAASGWIGRDDSSDGVPMMQTACGRNGFTRFARSCVSCAPGSICSSTSMHATS